jgi:UDP-N-acetylmuramate: L-alanyl-gamma-D-glutamyl-meso-diaminopimelate ligase
MTKKIHLIAIGGSVMHNFAIMLHQQGFQVTGTDDEIFEPAKSRLEKYGLLPHAIGWDESKITTDLEAVIVGMHAKADNPELIKAQELGLKIYSFPEYVYERAKNKQRIVIAGSHGKTTITAMIMHVLHNMGRKFDYLVGANLEGFETMVKLTEDAPVIVIEGDEYITSPLDRTPKFLKYQHHIALISGVAWDHGNVFPNFEEYVRQFDQLADATPKAGTLIFYEKDNVAELICQKERPDVTPLPYNTHEHKIINGKTVLLTEVGEVPVQVFGKHNMKNISGAKAVCLKIGVQPEEFYKHIATFKGAANRLELVAEKNGNQVYKDFAHAPSKLKATVEAVKNQFPKQQLVACIELHTYSSLSKDFLPEYKDTFNVADVAMVYYNPAVVAHKKLPAISEQEIKEAFNNPNLQIFTDSTKLKDALKAIQWDNKNLLMMSSGNFDGINLKELSKELLGN